MQGWCGTEWAGFLSTEYCLGFKLYLYFVYLQYSADKLKLSVSPTTISQEK